MTILSWDIEASNLNADFGIILCVGFKPVGRGHARVLSILDYLGEDRDLIRAERRMLKDLTVALLDADAWLTHYGTFFDIPFVNTRLLYHRLPTLPPTFPHIDTWKTARNRLKLRNNRLVTISEFLGTKDKKNAIKPEQWIRAMGGHVPSIAYIVGHCKRDVLALEQSYLRLRPLVVDHPNKTLIMGGKCPVCASPRLQKRGTHVSRTRLYQRFHCQDCGSWSKDMKDFKRSPRMQL